MTNPRLSLLALACLAAGLMGGCDRGGSDAAQEFPETPPAQLNDALNGTLDRSFAGEDIPAVTVTDPAGATLDLGSIDEPVLLNLWATWCAPCVVEMPLLDALAEDVAGQVRVLVVSEDLRGAELVEPFFVEREFTSLHPWMDPQNDLAFTFGGGPVLPLTVLYDAEGHEVWRVIGAFDWSSAEARELVLEAAAAEQAESR